MNNYQKKIEKHYYNLCESVFQKIEKIIPDYLNCEIKKINELEIEIYDFTEVPQKIATAHIQKLREFELKFAKTYLKIVPTGLAWVGMYGKIEFITNRENIENEILKKGIWFLPQNHKIIPVFSVNKKFVPLTTEHLQEVINLVFGLEIKNNA